VHESARSALFLSLNRNKRSIRVDLKHERGREVLLRLVRDHDVALESFRPGVLERLGVGYERMREENPGIVYCAISGYGQDSPKREASGHDMNYLGLVGLLGLTGEAGGWVTLGGLEPKFWQAFCRGVGREDLIERQFERPGTEAHAQVVEIFRGRTRAQWEQFAAAHDCCLEPVLELDEALSSELARAREMVVEIAQPGAER